MGRNERFEAMYRKYFGRVFRYFRGCGVSDAESQDLAQDTFKRFFEGMDRYRGEAEWAFLEMVALNVLRNWVRAAKTAKRSAKLVDVDDPEIHEQLEAPRAADFADQQHEALRRKQLHDAIEELSGAQRQCLKLWLDGLQYDEIAGALRISMDAVKSRIRDAKKLLSARLGEPLPEER
ncbi:MAG TPA: RNA polymerase sigma factor [Thermoanaerobaculia bacterium]|nr:RNA polymerase sigma factor [Thermoanaerobaculia bacterium]